MSKRKSKVNAEDSTLNSLLDDDSDYESDDDSDYDPSESESDSGEDISGESESDFGESESENTESDISEEPVPENTESIENTESEPVFSNTESDTSEKTESGTESVFSNTESETEDEDKESGTESDDESVSESEPSEPSEPSESEPSESEPSEGSDDESEFSEISQSISKIKDESKYDDLKAIDKAIGFWVEGVPYVLVKNKGVFSRIYIVGEINKKFHEIKGRLPKGSPRWNFIKYSEDCNIKNKLGGLTIIFRNLFGVCTISEYKEYKKSIDHQGPFIYDPNLKGGKKILFDAGKKVKKFFIVNPTPKGFRFEIK
jgi:hypothetical protein